MLVHLLLTVLLMATSYVYLKSNIVEVLATPDVKPQTKQIDDNYIYEPLLWME